MIFAKDSREIKRGEEEGGGGSVGDKESRERASASYGDGCEARFGATSTTTTHLLTLQTATPREGKREGWMIRTWMNICNGG